MRFEIAVIPVAKTLDEFNRAIDEFVMGNVGLIDDAQITTSVADSDDITGQKIVIDVKLDASATSVSAVKRAGFSTKDAAIDAIVSGLDDSDVKAQ